MIINIVHWYKEWNEVDKHLKYIFVDFENDIENIDCGGYTPIGTRVNYQLRNGDKESCWIYILLIKPKQMRFLCFNN